MGKLHLCKSALLPICHRVKALDRPELELLVQRISVRVGRCLERLGLLLRYWPSCPEKPDSR